MAEALGVAVAAVLGVAVAAVLGVAVGWLARVVVVAVVVVGVGRPAGPVGDLAPPLAPAFRLRLAATAPAPVLRAFPRVA